MFIIFFTLYTILFIPVMIMYHNAGDDESEFVVQLSLGNLGQAHSTCFHQYIMLDKEFNHKCYKGKISDLKYYGLIPVHNVSS